MQIFNNIFISKQNNQFSIFNSQFLIHTPLSIFLYLHQIFQKMKDILIEILGFSGMMLCLTAYAMNVRGRLSSDSKFYLLANGFGGAFLVLNSLWHWALPSAIENAVWSGIALWGFISRKK